VHDPGFECRQRQGILNNTFSIKQDIKFKYTPQGDKGENGSMYSHASLIDGDTF